MADEIRQENSAHAIPRKYKDVGDGTYAEVVALESGSIGGGGADPTYQEDTASVAAEKVIMAGVVRKDAAASLVDADGDRTELQVDSLGRLRVVVPAGASGLTDTELRASPVPVSGTVTAQDGGGSLTVDGTVTVQDGGGSITVDGTVTASAQPGVDIGDITINNAAGASAVNIQDGGNSITVDGTVGVSGAVDTELTTADLDTGAGTDTRAVIGLVRAESGGAVLVGSANPLPVSTGTVTVQDGGNVISVDDGAGSLTVDGSVSLAAAIPAGTNNIGDVDVLTLPALPAGTNNIGDVDVLTLPSIPAGNNNIGDVDVVTLPALPTGTNRIGSVQITDGTDEATVIPVRTQPATTEKALAIFDIPNRLATYSTVTAEIAPAITIGVKELLAIWAGSGETKDKYIVEIWLTALVTTASTTGGRTTCRLSTITSAPTGGTELTKVDVSGAGGASLTNTMAVKTGGGAIGTTFKRVEMWHATQAIGTRVSEPLFQASNPGNGIILRGGSASGISIDCERVVAHTALVDQWTVSVRWIEI